MEPTQGPYTVEHGSKGEIYVTADDGDTMICEVCDAHPNAEANAALLAASWEMREALTYAVNVWIADEPLPLSVWEVMRAALAKATQIT